MEAREERLTELPGAEMREFTKSSRSFLEELAGSRVVVEEEAVAARREARSSR